MNDLELDRNPFDGLISFKDACILYHLNESTLRRAVLSGRLIDGIDCKKLGNQWITTIDVLKRLYGEPPTEE